MLHLTKLTELLVDKALHRRVRGGRSWCYFDDSLSLLLSTCMFVKLRQKPNSIVRKLKLECSAPSTRSGIDDNERRRGRRRRRCDGNARMERKYRPKRLFQPQHPVDALDDEQDQRLPGHQPPDPVEELAVQNVRSFPAENGTEIEVSNKDLRRSTHGLQNIFFRSTFSLQYGHVCFLPMMHQPRMQNSWNT